MFKYKRKTRVAKLSIAPLLDMIFILLIFFVVTTTFSKLPGVKITLPESNHSDPLPLNNLLIGITETGGYVVHNRTYSEEGIREKLLSKYRVYPDLSVLILADELSAIKYSIVLMDLCKDIGIRDYALAKREGE